MKGIKCDNCAFFDELAEEQPCCGCVDGCYFVKNELDEENERLPEAERSDRKGIL